MAFLEQGEGGGSRIQPRTWLLIGGGVLAVYFLFLRPSQAAAPATGGSTLGVDPTSAELAMINAQAQTELNQLTAMNSFQSQQIASQYQMSQAGQRTCIAWSQWWALGSGDKQAITQQVSSGQAVLTPTTAGMCVTPTGQGLAGHAPPTTSSASRGLFGSSQTTTTYGGMAGAPAGTLPPPTLGNILQDILPLLMANYGGGTTDGYGSAGGAGGGAILI